MKEPWLEYAESKIGEHEIVGGENPFIIECHACTTLAATEDEISWCSSFANKCMKESGIKGTGLANARSWLNWGTKLTTPREGCIVVLKRGAPPSGHVGFFVGMSGTGYISILGGNQSDQVKVSHFPITDVIGYRWPEGVK